MQAEACGRLLLLHMTHIYQMTWTTTTRRLAEREVRYESSHCTRRCTYTQTEAERPLTNSDEIAHTAQAQIYIYIYTQRNTRRERICKTEGRTVHTLATTRTLDIQEQTHSIMIHNRSVMPHNRRQIRPLPFPPHAQLVTSHLMQSSSIALRVTSRL